MKSYLSQLELSYTIRKLLDSDDWMEQLQGIILSEMSLQDDVLKYHEDKENMSR